MLSKSIKKSSSFYRQFAAVAFIGLMIAFLVAVLRVNASMASFVVNTTADTPDATLSDNICADVTGACSLRAAITQANFSIGPDTITLPAGTYTITLVAPNDDLNAGGDFDILSEITINGAGAGTTIVQANAAPNTATERVFDIVNLPNRPEGWFASVVETFGGSTQIGLNSIAIRNGNLISGNGGGLRINRANTDVTIADSRISDNTGAQQGGGLWISSASTLTLNNSTISNNTVTSSQSNTQGGGIFNGGAGVNLTGTVISNNAATSTSPNNAGAGGGIQNLGGTVMITNSTISGNSSTVFAGINNSGTVTLVDSTVDGNTATGGGNFVGQGGGICNGGTLNLTNSTISNNSAAGFGYAGGILNQGGAMPATLNVRNSTFSGNSAHDAGNIYNSTGIATIEFSTFSGNTAVGNGATIYVDQNGVVNLRNTIVANGTSVVGPNLFTFSNGVYNSQGFNFIESIAGSNFIPQASDMIAQDPLLGPLGNNGGPTQTFLPGATSPVINSIPSGTNDCGVQFVEDQRGFGRPSGNGCDRGSVEVQGGTPAPLVVPLVVTGNDGDDTFDVKVFAPDGTLQRPVALGANFPGGRRVATADINGDGVPDVIVGSGPGGSHVKVFSGADGSVLHEFFAFDPGFAGGVFVGGGDVNNDGSDDLIVGAGAGGGPHVRVFSGQTGSVLQDFMAFSPNFTGGVFVAGGDVNGDGFDDIVVGAGPGGGSQVKVFDARVAGFEIHGFINTDDATDSGVPVGSGDFNRDGFADIITGTGPGGGPHVKVFDGTNVNRELASFFAFDPTFLGGVRVAGGDVNGDNVDDIIVGAGPGSPGPHVKVFSGTDGALLQSFFAYDLAFQGGIFVAAAGLPSTAPTPTPTPTPTPVRLVPPFVGVGPGPGVALDVRIFDPAGGPHSNYTPFGSGFTGGVRVATGDINGDGTPDLITGVGDGSSRVRVFDGLNGATLREFFAFPSFTGGVFVASGDVSGDGHADIIVGAGSSAQAGPGGGPHVRVFDGQTHVLHYDFFAYTGFIGGVRVAAGDVNGDGKVDIITGPANGTQAHVKVFDGSTGVEIQSFFAFDPSFTGGIFIGAGDINNDSFDDIIVGPDVGAAQPMKVFDGTNPGNVLYSFFAYGSGFQGGVRVAAGDVNGDGRADVITGAGPGAGPHVKIFSGLNGDEIGNFIAYTGLESPAGTPFQGGIFVTGSSPISGAGMGIEGDVAPRPNGNGSVISGDVIQMRRFATGLDTPSLDPNEFQRADSAPRTTFGDGMVNSGDVIQARRYATALDPLTPAAGPTGPPMIPNAIPSIFEDVYAYFFGREIRVTPQKPSEDRVTVAVEIAPYGDEMAVGFTIEYDAAKLSNPRLTLAEAAPNGSVLTANTNEKGRIGILVDSTEAFIASAVPKRFLMVTFDVAKGATGETPISLTGTLAAKATADANGNTLSVRYIGGSVDVTSIGKLTRSRSVQ
ncbi:MAG: FG-GAP-like repeat-containing protein [Pyrinomonadaceae bacterium]